MHRGRRRSFRPTLETLEGRVLMTVYLVTNTADSGSGSFRQAILDSNANTGYDLIGFSIGTGVQTITPLSALPTITDPVNIDAATQPGFSGMPIIELNGINAGPGVSGLEITAGGTWVRGFVINRFFDAAIHLRLAGNNVIYSCFLGTDVPGTAAQPNQYGVLVSDNSNNNIIGSSSFSNVISGNSSIGVSLGYNGTITTGNMVYGNFIGTDATGTASLGNQYGVVVNGGAANTEIGHVLQGNVISGNVADGLTIAGTFTTVLGNHIGTNPAGTAAIPNGGNGILTYGTKTLIGGTLLQSRNIISGNGASGIVVKGIDERVLNNYIGTDITGSVAVPNAGHGVEVGIGASGPTIGGTAAGFRNVISGNAQNGVAIGGAGVLVIGNYIGTDATGTLGVGNLAGGILIYFGSTIGIGGPAPGEGNVIAGNGSYNIFAVGAGAFIQGNYIGTDATGSVGLSASANGIMIDSATATIGGTAPGAGNLISGNFAGVYMKASGGNLVQGNRIGTNANGTAAVPNSYGIWCDGASSNFIGGTGAGARNLVSGNINDGIVIGTFASGNLIEGNFIGTDVTGTSALGNGRDGVFINSGANGNTVGGLSSSATNIISGNARAGVHLSNSGTSNNTVICNRIGTDVTGTAKIPNNIGVLIDLAASNNVVGGASVSARNIISGNSRIGVAIGGNNTNANRVEGNYIGTDATGSQALSNPVGVNVFRLAKNNIIGGAGPGKSNVISGNSSTGVLIRNNGTTGNDVRWNYIGTDPSGNLPIPNKLGISVNDFASGSLIDGNAIAFNTTEGILIDNATGIEIRTNSIKDNTSKGIRLNNNGNNLQPYPTITSVTNGGGSITIVGTLTAASLTTFSLDFFANPLCDGSGFGEGQTYIGSKSVFTNGAGSVAFSATFAANVPSGYMVAATATRTNGDTSEFSACFLAPIPPAPPPPVFWIPTVPLNAEALTFFYLPEKPTNDFLRPFGDTEDALVSTCTGTPVRTNHRPQLDAGGLANAIDDDAGISADNSLTF